MEEILGRKSVGDYVPLSEQYSLTVTGITHGEPTPLDMSRLLQYVFVVRARLQREGCNQAEAREIALQFHFQRETVASESAVEFLDGDRSCRLSVRFVHVPVHRPGDPLTADFRLVSRDLDAARETLKMDAPQKGVDSTGDRVTRSLDVLLLAVSHDKTEHLLNRHASSLMARAEQDRRNFLHNESIQRRGEQNLLVFWESDGTKYNTAVLTDAQSVARERFSLRLEDLFTKKLARLAKAWIAFNDPHRFMRNREEKSAAKKMRAAAHYYDDNGPGLFFTAGFLCNVLGLMTRLGRAQTMVLLEAVFGTRRLVETFIARSVQLYEETLLPDAERQALLKARDEWAATTPPDAEAWYFTEFFSEHIVSAKITIKRPAKELVARLNLPNSPMRNYVMDTMRFLVYGGAGDTDVGVRMGDDLDAWERQLKQRVLGAEAVAPLLDELGRVHRALDARCVLNDAYLTALATLVFTRVGHPGTQFYFVLEALAFGWEGALHSMKEIINRYREVMALVHVLHVARLTGASRCVLWVGSAHSSHLKSLFEWSGNRVSGPVIDNKIRVPRDLPLSGEARALIQAYLELERLSLFSEPRQYSSASVLARLPLYLLLTEADGLLDYSGIKDRFSFEARQIALLMQIFVLLFDSVSPFASTALVRVQKKERQRDVDWIAAIRQRYAALPQLVVEMLVQCRATRPVLQRAAGQWFEGERADRYLDPDSRLELSVLRTDWIGKGAGQLAVERRCQQTLGAQPRCMRCACLYAPKRELSLDGLVFCGVHCQRAHRLESAAK